MRTLLQVLGTARTLDNEASLHRFLLEGGRGRHFPRQALSGRELTFRLYSSSKGIRVVAGTKKEKGLWVQVEPGLPAPLLQQSLRRLLELRLTVGERKGDAARARIAIGGEEKDDRRALFTHISTLIFVWWKKGLHLFTIMAFGQSTYSIGPSLLFSDCN